MKVRHRYRFGRLWFSAAAILLGILAGYSIGRNSILHTTESRLAEYGERVMEHDEDVSREVGQVLGQVEDLVAKQPQPAAASCSEEEITLLRRLTFAARFLKDVGRVRDNAFLCTATYGRLVLPLTAAPPDMALEDSSLLYRSYPLPLAEKEHVAIVVHSNAAVVVSPDAFAEFPQKPMHYALGTRDHTGQVSYFEGNTPVTFPPEVTRSARVLRVRDTLYRGRCSDHFSICVVTSIRMADVWRDNSKLLTGYTTTGGIAGLCCAIALLFTGNTGRSQTYQLKRAILMGKLSVAYQPIVELGSHRIVGVEALARWTDEAGDSIRPETIIALAEAEGFVSEITRFVLTRSLEELQSILEINPHFRIHINLAPSDLADPRLLLLLDENLQGPQQVPSITAANITFELTERATSDRQLATAAIARLRQRGHSVYIDDFGTGYSNLAYLNELNVDGIKINRSFIATIGTDSVTASIVPQILAVASALNLSVVVQGIEREEQAIYFAAENPTMLGQGWYFGLPISARSLMYICAERSE